MTINGDSRSLWGMDKDHFIHPYTDFSCFDKEGSQIISEASGVHVTDNEGKRYLDGIAGLWCVNIGHGRKEMAEAISAQVLKMQYYNPFGHSTNEPAALLSAKLASLAPKHINHVFYSGSGSAANDIAARLAHYYFEQKGLPNKKQLIARTNAYHGSTYFAASLTGIESCKIKFNDIAQDLISRLSAANMYRCPEGMHEAAYCDHLVKEFEDRIAQLGADNIAAFFAEPIMGAGGVLVAPEGYHKRMWEVCQANDILYIADEVVTAFGRLGQWFSSETVYGYKPDIIVTAKGISSGYIPLGATLISDDIYEAISKPQCPGGALTLGFTYSGHAVACAAALKNIEIIERENLLEHVREAGPYFQKKMQGLQDLSIVGDVRGSHFMLGIELVSDKASKSYFDATINVAQRVFKRCQQKGLVIRPIVNLIVLSPPLIFSKSDCNTAFDILYSSIKETIAELTVTGLLK